MAQTIDHDYTPPLKDPQQEGRQHWDKMRQELMLARDLVRQHEADIAAKDRRIDDLVASAKVRDAILEENRNELASLRASLQNIGGIILTALAEAKKARSGGDDYKPPAIPTPPRDDPVPPEELHKLEQILSIQQPPVQSPAA